MSVNTDTSKIKDNINQQMHIIELGAYRRGFEDGKNDSIAKIDEARAKGRKEAWEAARKIELSERDGGYTYNELMEIFGTAYSDDIFRMMCEDVIEKFAAYEKERGEQEMQEV